MSIQIQISNHVKDSTIYDPGDTINGTVNLRGPPRDEALTVFIEFHGTTAAAISISRHSVNHYLKLSAIRKEVYIIFYLLDKGSEMPWEFSLAIPKYTLNHREFRKNTYWAAGVHDLPPNVAVVGYVIIELLDISCMPRRSRAPSSALMFATVVASFAVTRPSRLARPSPGTQKGATTDKASFLWNAYTLALRQQTERDEPNPTVEGYSISEISRRSLLGLN
jgi:hypothetical protein